MRTLRSALEPGVRRLWAGDLGPGGGVLSLLALPPEGLYRSAVALRNLLHDSGLRRARRAPIPVVSVGNLAVGGAGKTPVAAWIARRLREMGERPAVLLRGYGADEERLHRRWGPELLVVADPDRHRAAEKAAAAGAGIAVLDDGFQHRRLARDLDIVLVAAEQRFPGPLLPRGPYREGPAALARAHVVVVTRRTASDARVEETLRRLSRFAPQLPCAVLSLEPCAWTDLGGGAGAPPSGEVLAVTGIAEPRLFLDLLQRTLHGAVDLLAFPDHHPFDEDDARRIGKAARDRTVVVTEKDAVKLVGLRALLPPVRVLALAVRAQSGEAALDEALARIAGGAAATAAGRAGSRQGGARSGRDPLGDAEPREEER